MRIVALTLDPSLGAALNMLDDWEIATAADVEAVILNARGSSLVLIGVGGTEEGLDVAQQIHSRGVTIPALVVGEGPIPASAFAPVLLRPFSLDDLRGAVAAAISGAAITSSAPEPALESPVTEVAPKKAPKENDGVVVELHKQSAPIPEEPPPPAPKLNVVNALSAVPATEGEPRQPRSLAPPPAAPPTPAMKPGALEEEQKELRRRLGAHHRGLPTVPEDLQVEAPARRRGFGRRGPGDSRASEIPTESPFVQRLRAAASAARDVEQLIDELPAVSDVNAMGEAFLAEALNAFSPEIASVYLREAGLFRIVASYGLSRVEQGLEVEDTHPLFAQVLLSSEPVLIAPVDLARGLVGGIAGARTEALMVGPVHVDGECVAALVVGRSDFSDDDLELLDALAREAGPGLALARALRSLRGK